MKLIVTEPFADFQRGDEITDPDLVAAILEDERQCCVVRAAEPQPEPDAE
ncbi:MAG: hypothetical protein ACK4MG_04190 [Aquabacterium sp.]